MRIKITESEKQRIIGLYNPKFLVEAVGNMVTIRDLQTLIGVTPDNQLGPQTMAKLKSVLKSIPSSACGSNAGEGASPEQTGLEP